MKKTAIIILLLQTLCFSQTFSKKNLIGKYVGIDNCKIMSFRLKVGKHGKFKSKYTGHYFTNKIDKGTWKINGDTLILQRKNENWCKFRIKEKRLCEITEDTAFCKFCIIKK